jgi:hypothetical protein
MTTSATAMKLIYHEVPDWPKLTWLAKLPRGSNAVTVLHGPCVETNASWCAEAVWPGAFAEGNFDQTDVVVGTGLRVRSGKIVFVTSGDTLNRLHYYEGDEAIYVSNSLPAMMAVADLSFVPGFDYVHVLKSIVNGLTRYLREIPTNRAPIRQIYFDNLLLSDGGAEEIAKPCRAPEFENFSAYRNYLFETARQIGENARAAERRHSITTLVAISNGYDSSAAAVLAREAGARDAVSIRKARREPAHLLNLEDSGAAVAEQLGMTCSTYARKRTNYSFEDAVWAAMGNVGDVNLALFDYPSPLCLLFTGFMGDVLWAKTTRQSEPLHRKDTSGARFSECRLALGVFNCAPTFWGCQRESQILDLSHLAEMAPWSVSGDYDRPVPRRIVEEAGVRRGTFAKRKKAASFNRRLGRPLSKDLHADFASFIKQRGDRASSGLTEWISLCLRGLEWVIVRRLPKPLRFRCGNWIALPDPTSFFIWGSERCKRRYLAGLRTLPDAMPPLKSAVQADLTFGRGGLRA